VTTLIDLDSFTLTPLPPAADATRNFDLIGAGEAHFGRVEQEVGSLVALGRRWFNHRPESLSATFRVRDATGALELVVQRSKASLRHGTTVSVELADGQIVAGALMPRSATALDLRLTDPAGAVFAELRREGTRYSVVRDDRGEVGTVSFSVQAPFGRPSIGDAAPGSFAFAWSADADALVRIAGLAAVIVWAARHR
jgi:hypothetical protein